MEGWRVASGEWRVVSGEWANERMGVPDLSGRGGGLSSVKEPEQACDEASAELRVCEKIPLGRGGRRESRDHGVANLRQSE